MTWKSALGAGLALQVLAGVILGLVLGTASDDLYSDAGPSGLGVFLVAVVLTAGSIFVLAGTIGWGVTMGLKEDGTSTTSPFFDRAGKRPAPGGFVTGG